MALLPGWVTHSQLSNPIVTRATTTARTREKNVVFFARSSGTAPASRTSIYMQTALCVSSLRLFVLLQSGKTLSFRLTIFIDRAAFPGTIIAIVFS